MWKKIGISLIGLILSIGSTARGQPQQSPSKIEIIVRLSRGADGGLQSTLENGRTGILKKGADSLFHGVQSATPIFSMEGRVRKSGRGTPSIRAYTLQVRDSTAFRQLLGRWRRRSDVQYAHPNYSFQVHGGARERRTVPDRLRNNAFADSLDHLEVIQALDAWGRTAGRSTVEIGVVDTGFYLDHPDLTDQFWVNEKEDLNGNGRFDPADRNGIDDDGNGFVDDVIGYDFVDRSNVVQEGEFETRDPDPSADPSAGGSGHGTSVAGIATASPGTQTAGIAGVAPDTRLVALRAFGGDGFGESDDIAAAIAYGASMGIDVLNLSFGRSRSVPLIRDAIEYADAQGTVVVASAGNELTDDPHYPSDYPEVLSVVWLAEDGEGLPDFNRSQFGIGVDIGAPGSNVFTSDFPVEHLRSGSEPPREELYRSVNGSSFSAPQVSGAAALLRSADSTLSPASIRSILTATADDLVDENWDHTTGAGLLNVSRSLSRAYPAQTEIQYPRHDQGFAHRTTLPIVGTAVDPSFEEYAVQYAAGTDNLDERSDPWVEISPPRSTQVLRDTLARWDLSSLEEGEYTLRLVMRLRDGRTIEDRRRVIIDRSPPKISIHFLGSGRVQGENGVIGDVSTDDLTRLATTVRLGTRNTTVKSERVARRHGLTWADDEGTGGAASLTIVAKNRSGLTSQLDTTLQLSKSQENTALLSRTSTSIPRGRLLPMAPDFDEDGLQEVVVNQTPKGGLTDTLRAFEWTGSGFAPADTLIASLFPKDVGDTNRNGRKELLLQVRGATLVLEQRRASAFPDSLVYADTTGGSEGLVSGIKLTNLDSDSQGELLGTTGEHLTVLERASSGEFSSVLELSNPTSTTGRDSALANKYDTPQAQTGDFDGDGNRDLLAGDRDGDVIVYESTGDDAMTVAWSHETDRVDAGNRFAAGNVVAGGGQEFATMTTSFPRALKEGELEPPITYYSVWEGVGDNEYRRRYRLPIAGAYVGQGAMKAVDVDGDGLEEIVLAHSPSLIVIDRTSGGDWRVLHEHRGDAPLQSRSLVAADFSGNGRSSLLAESVDDQLQRFVVDSSALAVSPPRWTRARPTGASSSALEWRAPGADSVAVYGGPPGGALNPIAVVTDSSLSIGGSAERRFALRAWEGGTASPLSSHRTIRPHAPASLTSIEYPSPTSVQLRFTEALEHGLRKSLFRLGVKEQHPQRIVQTNAGYAAVLHFSEDVAGRTLRLRWSGVSDADGLGVGDTTAVVSFPAPNRRSLFIETAKVLDQQRVRLRFNEPLDSALATQRDRYKIRPQGHVAAIEQRPETPRVVTLRIEGVVIGANGLESSLTVTEMRSTNGSRLSKEGGTVRLTRPAEDLSNVYVYPNPYRSRQHDGSLTISGLPRTASVRIYSPDGRLVRELSIEDDRDGGKRWDLRDRRGERVPSGIYLFRVNAPGHPPVLEKAAVIR